MNTRFANITSRLALGFAILFTIAACGGGGGGGGGFTGESGTPPPDSYFLSIAFLDSDGNPTNTITSTDTATIEVTVTLNVEGGAAVPDVVVSATADIGVLSPDNSQALTDSDGIATLFLAADGVLGAGTLIVSADSPAGEVSASKTYQVSYADLQLGYYQNNVFIPGEIGVSAGSLPSGGSALLTVNVVNAAGEPATTVELINFTSNCARSGLATIPSPVATVNGLATTTYTAAGCTESDIITASLDNGSSEATAILGIAAPAAGSVNFVAAVPKILALRGTGGAGRKETSAVTFEVVDGNGTAVSGIPVEFALSTDVGGITLSTTLATTVAEGKVSTTVRSGNVATPVRVIATIEVEDEFGDILELSTVSDELVVTSGLPDQDSISISTELLSVPGALDIDGVTSQITVRMADKFNNPVPDGTAATFNTEYGSIGGSCTTSNGSCSVTWTSQAPRVPSSGDDDVTTIYDSGYSCPSHNGSFGPCPDDIVTSGTRGAISRITVIAIGEEVFTDRNGNGVFDQDEEADGMFELSNNLPEAFNDYNDDGVFTPAGGGSCRLPVSLDNCSASGFEETPYDFNNNGEYDFNDDPAVYNGILCPLEGDGVWCSRELVHVRDSLNIMLSPSAAGSFDFVLTRSGTVDSRVTEDSSYIVYTADRFNNPPANQKVSVTSTGRLSDPQRNQLRHR